MAQHDTAAIRRLARRVDSTASTLSGYGRNAAARIESLNSDLLGETSNAIGTATDRLNSEIQSIRNGLARCADMLYQYARELDIADARSRDLISRN